MKFLFLALCSIIVMSCGTTAFIDYNETTDFITHKTFQFSKKEESTLSPFDQKRILHAIDSVLVSKTWQRTDYCQFYIDFFVETSQEESRNTLGVGVGSGGGGFGVGATVAIPIGPNTVLETLTIEVYEAYNNGDLVWQGSLEANRKENFTPQQKEIHYAKMVAKILKEYPPKVQ